MASAVMAPFSGYGDIWWPSSAAKVYRAVTPLDNGTETAGWWWTADDNENGGKSTIVWPAKRGTAYDDNSFDNIIYYCGGLCGTAILKQDELIIKPYVVVAFDVVGLNSTTHEAEIGDATQGEWADGICITYTSDSPIDIQIGLGVDGDKDVGYANPFVTLPKSVALKTMRFSWSDFEQPTWAPEATKLSGEEAAAKISSLKFQLMNNDGSYNFNIMEIGTYNACDAH